MEVVIINGKKRDGVGKKATKAVRKTSEVPCVIYGAEGVTHFQALEKDFRHLIYTPDFKIAEIFVDGKKYRCILKDKQLHPVNESLLHLDFLQLTPGRPIKVNIPVRFTGSSVGVKAGGKLIQSIRRVQIKCVPEAMITELTVDISDLDLGQSVRVRDIIVPNGIEMMNAGSIPLGLIEIPRALRSAQTEAAKKK
jgi:large subunit ribosomal protein L25